MAFEIRTTAWRPGGVIPARHTCDGPDLSPPVAWAGPPKGTKSLVLIVDDPDAPGGTWVHWVVYGVPPGLLHLAEGVARLDRVPGVCLQGVNDFRKVGYNGPCPPRGAEHRYFFRLYALSSDPHPPPRATKDALLKQMEGQVLGHAEMMGRYTRR